RHGNEQHRQRTREQTSRSHKSPNLNQGIAINQSPLGPPPFRQLQLIRLLRSRLEWSSLVPRGNRTLVRWIERFHRLPHRIHPVSEEIADQQICDRTLKARIGLDERSEAETIVILTYEPAHTVDARVEFRAPFSELRRGRISL